jgi:uncharacterized membrane protein
MADEYEEDDDRYVLDEDTETSGYQTNAVTDSGYMERVKQKAYDHGAEGGGAVIGGLGGAAVGLPVSGAIIGGATGYLGKKTAEYLTDRE